MKKKGFTLVELLAVIVLIGLLSILLVPKMIERFEIKKEELSNQAKELIYLATSQYMEVFNSDASCVSIRDLIDNGFLIEPVIDPKSNTVISTSTSVKISKKNNQYNYEISDTCFYDVTFDLKRVSVDRKDFTMKDESVEVTITPNNNFILPDTINVKGSNYTWNKDTGKLVLKNAYSNVIVKIAGVPIDKENPTIIVSPSSGSYEGSVSITISVNDNLGLDPNNVYQYYLSTSSTKRENGSWTSYTSDVPFEITGDDETKYLWIWPVKDSVGNINSDKSNVNTPYVAGIYKFGEKDKTPPVLTVNEVNKTYDDGEVVYFDVLKGTRCTNYHEDNSLTGYNGVTTTTDNQNSCLKFYAFNDDEGDSKLNLLLDHNTTAYLSWSSAKEPNGSVFSLGYNVDGPKEVIEQLKIDTDEWVGTITPENYTVSQTGSGNYTIDYSGYKARLITANEIAEITGNTSFDESTTVEEISFSSTCTSENIDGCSYGWLYDRTSTSCTDNGCLNNAESDYSSMWGYWTSTSNPESSAPAWAVSDGSGLYRVFLNVDMRYGVRPVIEVSKENIETSDSIKTVVITAYDNESGLSSENTYKYYLSTSSTTLENGTWTNYTIGDVITINQDKTLYLWIYPIKDNVGNVNDNKEFNTPYMAHTLEKIYDMYENGEVVYYDVLKGTTCTNYHEDNSKTGYNGVTTTTENQTSCLKFYAYNDDEKNGALNLLLDHNTPKWGYWATADNSNIGRIFITGYNGDGPKEVIEQLKTDTDDWVGTLTPANYTVSQETGGNYTIDYSDYKARLITANEIAEITGNTSFDESTSTTSNWFWFDTNTTSESDTCKSGNISGCSYGWLYDRTYTSCTEYGCLNDDDYGTQGYWTSTSTFGSSDNAWFVRFDGSLIDTYSIYHNLGVRPVIEVLKSQL